MTTRALPSPQWLAESRRRNNVPDDWEWFECANPACSQSVWIPPGVQSAAKSQGTVFLPVCSPECTIVAFVAADRGNRSA